MFDLERLALLVEAPRAVPPSPAQLELLGVLADEWIEGGRPAGLWLAEMLQGRLTAARLDALGFGEWGVDQDPRYVALSMAPDFAASCAALVEQRELDMAISVLAWSGHADDSLLHVMVAEHVRALLTRVEDRTLKVVSRQDCRFRLENQWSLEVFLRGERFWRIDEVISPEGFVLDLWAFGAGPLASLLDYEPPPDVLSEVYGLGDRPVRQW